MKPQCYPIAVLLLFALTPFATSAMCTPTENGYIESFFKTLEQIQVKKDWVGDPDRMAATNQLLFTNNRSACYHSDQNL